MNKKIIATTLFTLIGCTGVSSAWACSLLPQPAAAICNLACDNLSGMAQMVCKLGRVHHNH